MARYKMYKGVPRIVREMKGLGFSLKDIEYVTKLKKQSIYNFLKGGKATRKKEGISVTNTKKLLSDLEKKCDLLKDILYKHNPKKSLITKLGYIEYAIEKGDISDIKALVTKKQKILKNIDDINNNNKS